MVRKIADDSVSHFAASGDIGRKYLVDHSAGSGKTLSICWLADRLHSLFKPGTSEKVVNVIFILTDRKSLDTNIREDIEKFTHLKDVIGLHARPTICHASSISVSLSLSPHSRNSFGYWKKSRRTRSSRKCV